MLRLEKPGKLQIQCSRFLKGYAYLRFLKGYAFCKWQHCELFELRNVLSSRICASRKSRYCKTDPSKGCKKLRVLIFVHVLQIGVWLPPNPPRYFVVAKTAYHHWLQEASVCWSSSVFCEWRPTPVLYRNASAMQKNLSPVAKELRSSLMFQMGRRRPPPTPRLFRNVSM